MSQESRLPPGQRSFTQLQSKPWGPKFITAGRLLTFTLLASVYGSYKLAKNYAQRNHREAMDYDAIGHRPAWARVQMDAALGAVEFVGLSVSEEMLHEVAAAAAEEEEEHK